MGTERVGKLMGQYAVPCIISLLVGALYNIVDQIFIANASYLGSYGNAANTVVFPLTVVALAIAVMVGDGCCAFVSMALGRNEINDARRSVGNAVVLTVAGSLVLTALYLIFADGIIAMFGGTVNAETFRCSQEYFFYITLGILMERSGSQSRSGSTAKGYVTKAKNYIAHNYTLGIGVENATDFVGVSRATLYRAFMEYEGLSPAQYITDFRVNAACRLLEETELPVSAVARSVGYNDSLYFSRIFHKTKGVSPTEYRADALCTKGENKAFSVDKGI